MSVSLHQETGKVCMRALGVRVRDECGGVVSRIDAPCTCSWLSPLSFAGVFACACLARECFVTGVLSVCGQIVLVAASIRFIIFSPWGLTHIRQFLIMMNETRKKKEEPVGLQIVDYTPGCGRQC